MNPSLVLYLFTTQFPDPIEFNSDCINLDTHIFMVSIFAQCVFEIDFAHGIFGEYFISFTLNRCIPLNEKMFD